MKGFQRFMTSALAAVTALTMLAGCSSNPQASSGSQTPPSSSQNQPAPSSKSEITSSVPESSEPASFDSTPTEPESGKTLVVYFSASGNTKAVAEVIAGHMDAETYELVPAEPYSEDDLEWTDSDSRVNAEHNDPNHRTEIAGEKDLSGYDTIFIGYPLWWQQAPSIVWNFVENADLAGKTMIPFCTSMSSPFGTSGETLAGMAPDANWLTGIRFGENPDASAVTDWVDSLELTAAEPAEPAENSTGSTSAAENTAGDANILVAYFSVPEDVDTTGVDAIAGASVLVSNGTVLGNMQYMAQIIQRETGADIYRIESEQEYPLDHQPLIDQAQQEQRNNDRPAIAGELPDLSGYDVIFLGYPNWWGDMPMILYTFLDQCDLSGKTMIPFCVHGGSGFSGTIRSIRELEPGAEVLDGLTISRNSIGGSEAEIVGWVNGLNLE